MGGVGTLGGKVSSDEPWHSGSLLMHSSSSATCVVQLALTNVDKQHNKKQLTRGGSKRKLTEEIEFTVMSSFIKTQILWSAGCGREQSHC